MTDKDKVIKYNNALSLRSLFALPLKPVPDENFDADDELSNFDREKFFDPTNFEEKRERHKGVFNLHKEWKNSVFIMIPVRIGMNSIDPEYLNTIKKLMTCPFSTGFIGKKHIINIRWERYSRNVFLRTPRRLVDLP